MGSKLEELVHIDGEFFVLDGRVIIKNPERFEIRTTKVPTNELPRNFEGFVWTNMPKNASHYSTTDSNGMKKIIYYEIPNYLVHRL